MYYVPILSYIMCRFRHALCADFSMSYVQIYARLMCRFMRVSRYARLARFARYISPPSYNCTIGGGSPHCTFNCCTLIGNVQQGGRLPPPYCTFSVQVVSCVMCSFILSYVQTFSCLMCRFLYVLCEFQSKRARFASPGSLRSLCVRTAPVRVLNVQCTLLEGGDPHPP